MTENLQFTKVNFHLYHYAGNNPVRYIDPDGESIGGKVLGFGCYFAAGVVAIAGTAVTTTGQIYLTAGAAKLALALISVGATVLTTDIINDSQKDSSSSLTVIDNTALVTTSPKEEISLNKQSLPDMKKNPPNHPDYKPPKNWDGEKVRNPNGNGSGWPAKNGDVWQPTDHNGTHSPHWDVQHKNGTHTPVYPE